MTNLPENFKTYLISQRFSPATVKNYLSDANHFFKWLEKKTGVKQQIAGKAVFALFTSETLNEYKADQTSSRTPPSTINRRLSALRKLGAFAQTQGWLQPDSAWKITNADGGDQNWLNKFKVYLEKEKASPLTIKNYLSDLRHFLGWLETI